MFGGVVTEAIMSMYESTEVYVATIIAYICVFLVFFFGIKLVAWLLKESLKSLNLGGFDRLRLPHLRLAASDSCLARAMVRGLLVVFVAVAAQIEGIDGIADYAKKRGSCTVSVREGCPANVEVGCYLCVINQRN